MLLAVVLAGLAGSRSAHAAASPDGDVIRRDFGTLVNSEGERGSRLLAGSGRIADPNDRLDTTAYRDSTRRISVKATVLTFGDPTWLVQELTGEFTAKNGLAFSDGTTVVGDGPSRRLETRPQSDDETIVVIGWPSGSNRLVKLEFLLKGDGREAEIPTQILDAYLGQYPSSLPADVTDTPKYHLEWLHSEMTRLLAYAKRNLDLAHEALEGPNPSPPKCEQQRVEAVRLLRRVVALRQAVYGVGNEDDYAAAFQKAEVDAITKEQTLDKAKILAFTDQQLHELEGWWEARRDDW